MTSDCIYMEFHIYGIIIIFHNTRWFKYDRDKLWLVYTKSVPVIFEPPCTFPSICKNTARRTEWSSYTPCRSKNAPAKKNISQTCNEILLHLLLDLWCGVTSCLHSLIPLPSAAISLARRRSGYVSKLVTDISYKLSLQFIWKTVLLPTQRRRSGVV